MIDIETHRVIDLLPSREIKDVAEWLMTYPNLKIISRDGSVSYNYAIKQANKNIQQVSDRFHLLKGLTDAAKQVMTSHLTAIIGIPASASHSDGNRRANYWEKEIKKDDLPTREHNSSYAKKKKLVEKVLELTEKGFNISQIALETGLSRSTVKRYRNPDYKITNGMYNTTLNSNIKPYSEKIKQMLEEKYTFKKIEEAIRKDGYAGSASTIRMYTTRERRRLKESLANGIGNTEKIERKCLISLLYKPIDKVKKIFQEQFDKVIENQPVIILPMHKHLLDHVLLFSPACFFSAILSTSHHHVRQV